MAGCELLSKIIIFVMKDNFNSGISALVIVVNCFQKLLSSWWRTTNTIEGWFTLRLWIAFKNYYLRDEGQRSRKLRDETTGCELLSKIIIFVMKDNTNEEVEKVKVVVNCFQKLLSSWWRTTDHYSAIHPTQLWIAFKNYYLRDEGQLLFICS